MVNLHMATTLNVVGCKLNLQDQISSSFPLESHIFLLGIYKCCLMAHSFFTKNLFRCSDLNFDHNFLSISITVVSLYTS